MLNEVGSLMMTYDRTHSITQTIVDLNETIKDLKRYAGSIQEPTARLKIQSRILMLQQLRLTFKQINKLQLSFPS